MSSHNLLDSIDANAMQLSGPAHQQTIADDLGIKGLRYERGFISEEEQSKIIQLVDANPWLDDLKRRVQHYGYKYDYTARRIDASMHLGNLPSWLQDLGERLVTAGIFAVAPDQVIVNEYLPGQGIAAHIDCQPCFEDTVVSLTTLSGCSMDFIDINSEARRSVYLEPCSIVILKDDARYLWRHGISKSQKDVVDGKVRKRKRRVSLTFRKVKW